MLRLFKKENAQDQEFSKDVAHVEIGPGVKKPPREIPVLKIIITVLALGLVLAFLITGILLILIQNDFLKNNKDAKTAIEAKLKSYPGPQKNQCGEEVAMCGDGTVLEKIGPKCEFRQCPEFASDMTKFWNVKNSSDEYVRTYENLDQKYEFDIEKTWDFVGLDYGFTLYSPNYDCGREAQANKSICDGTILEMISSNTTAKQDVEEWFKSKENYFVINSDNPPPETYNLVSIAGVKAIEVEDSNYSRSYYFIKDNFVYAIRTNSAGELDFRLAQPYIVKLLNSFRFLQN